MLYSKKKKWIEVGIFEGQTCMIIDKDTLDSILRKNNKICLYHLHPNLYSQRDDRLHELKSIYNSLPSPADISCMISSYFTLKNYHQSAEYSFNVVSINGISYTTPKISSQLSLNQIKEKIREEGNKLESKFNNELEQESLIQFRDKIIQIKELCNSTYSLVKIDFKSWEDLGLK